MKLRDIDPELIKRLVIEMDRTPIDRDALWDAMLAVNPKLEEILPRPPKPEGAPEEVRK